MLRPPPRIGNAAFQHLQLDIYGEALDGILKGDDYGLEIAHSGWLALTSVVDWVADNWDQPDEGIWEVRGGGLRHFLSRCRMTPR